MPARLPPGFQTPFAIAWVQLSWATSPDTLGGQTSLNLRDAGTSMSPKSTHCMGKPLRAMEISRTGPSAQTKARTHSFFLPQGLGFRPY